MKKLWNFIVWNYRDFDRWNIVWYMAMFVFGFSLGAEAEERLIYQTIAAGLLFIWIAKWAIWDSIKNSWSRYNQEQEQLVEILSKKN